MLDIKGCPSCGCPMVGQPDALQMLEWLAKIGTQADWYIGDVPGLQQMTVDCIDGQYRYWLAQGDDLADGKDGKSCTREEALAALQVCTASKGAS